MVPVTEPSPESELYAPPPRYLANGHRASWNGLVPIETRRYPMWWWPFEIAARWQARLVKRLPEHLRYGYEADSGHP